MILLIWLWRKELLYLLICIINAALISYFLGCFLQMLVLILVVALIRQAIFISRLESWLRRGGGGKLPSGSGVWSDIYYHFYQIKKTEKQRKKKLGKIIDQFRKSTDVLPDAAVVLGRSQEIEWSNKLSRLVLGIKKSDKGQRLDNLIRSPEFSEFLSLKDEELTLTMPSPIDSKIILLFRIVNYGIGQHLVIAQDITQQKNLEMMRKNFVDNVSHELRTPLTVIKGYLETLEYSADNRSKKMIGRMNEQAVRMQLLIDDLLLLARLESQKYKKVCIDVPELLKEVCSEANAINPLNQRVVLSLDSSCKVYGDKKDLHSAFTNIIVNALKYSAVNTSVKVIWKINADKILLDVIDKGEGIKHSEISRITERFYRVEVKRSKKMSGTGLGLAIVKHVMIRHDAKLEITSKLGQGSRFRCVFPASSICI